MEKKMNNSSESLVPMEDMIKVLASYIEELRIVVERLKRAEDGCMKLLLDEDTLQSPTAVLTIGKLVFVDLMLACGNVEKMVKEYDAQIEDRIDNFTENGF